MTRFPPVERDPAPMLERVRADLRRLQSLWIFGYGSLIWRPEFDSAEHRPALVRGWHRALRMRSRVNRGTPEEPGLVFAMLPGGACRGMAYRLHPDQVEESLQKLWAREMVTGVYDPRFVRAHTPLGEVTALAFTLSRRSPACHAHLDDGQMLHILRHSRGRYGTTLEYLVETALALRAHGVHDREVERLVNLAARHGLLHAGHPGAARATPSISR